MPHKVEISSSSASSRTSSGERVAVTNGRDPARRTNPKVVIHNGGGPRYDEKRPASWDKNRWK